MKTGNTRRGVPESVRHLLASMEPGHEDREYLDDDHTVVTEIPPQWSPVMKTGNTRGSAHPPAHAAQASMEPGHEDREYRCGVGGGWRMGCGLNGARS